MPFSVSIIYLLISLAFLGGNFRQFGLLGLLENLLGAAFVFLLGSNALHSLPENRRWALSDTNVLPYYCASLDATA